MKTIEYKGKKYTKHSNGYYSRMERVQLHRIVWEDHFGPIQEGYCIHHKDKDKTNNDIANLECISKSDHVKHHWEIGGEDLRQKVKENIKKAHLWRGTAEGREYSSKHHKKLWQNAKIYKRICTVCNKEFESLSRKKNIYCSSLCHSRGYYDKVKEQRICQICENKFEIYRYSKTMTCSKTCTLIKANKSRKKTIEMKTKERIEKLLE